MQDESERLMVHMDAQYDTEDIPWLGARLYTKTGRVRVLIEGEEDLVFELLGKNFSARLARLSAILSVDDAAG